MKPQLIVVGNGMASIRVVEHLIEQAPELYDITVFGGEPHGSYNRILLSSVLAGEKTVDDIVTHPPEWFAERGISLHMNDPITAINRARRTVTAKSGLELKYDRLLLATGSVPFMLPLPGKDLPGVIAFRDMKDVEAMIEASRQYRYAAVIGGGLLGIEAANGLLRRGMKVTLIHRMATLMEQQLDPHAAGLLSGTLRERRLDVRLNADTQEIFGHQRVTGIRFKEGPDATADIVVMAVGIRPNVELAKKSGIRCDRAIVVNDTLQTYDPRIYAVGECVQHRGSVYGLVAPLWEQARVCAIHLAQYGHSSYKGSVVSAKLKVSGIDLFSTGDFIGGAGTEDLVYRDPRLGIYKRLVVKEQRLVGAVLYGDVTDGPWYFDLIKSRADIGPIREHLVFGKVFCEAA